MWYTFVRFYINHAEETPSKQIKLGRTPNCSAIHETRNTVVMQLSSNSGNRTGPGMLYTYILQVLALVNDPSNKKCSIVLKSP